jgi:hypothetical protein
MPGAENYLIFSLLTFFTFFVLVGLYLIWMDKNHLEKMASMPLNQENSQDKNSKN